MKKVKLFGTLGLSILMIASATLLTNCKEKAVDPTPLTNTQKITHGNYRMVAFTVNPGIYDGNTTVTDIYNSSMFTDCSKDDLTKFKADKTVVSDAGTVKCDPSEPQTTTGTWAWNTDETIITITQNGDSQSYNVVTNDGNNLVINYTQNDNGTNYKFTLTFKAQ